MGFPIAKTIQQENPLESKLFNLQTRISKLNYDFELKKPFIEKCLQALNASDWKTDSIKEGVKISYRHVEESPIIDVKYETIVKADIKRLISLIYEAEYFPKWIPFCSQSKVLKKIGLASMVNHLTFNIPFISKRESNILGEGYNLLYKNGSILVVVRSIYNTDNLVKENGIQLEKINGVELTFNHYIFQITPKGALDNLEVIMIENSDTHLKGVPTSIINYLIRKFGVSIFKKIIKLANHKFEGSVWDKSIKEDESKKEFYDWIDRVYNEYGEHLKFSKNQFKENK